MKISVVIPVYNERNTIEQIVTAVRAAEIGELEIIVVDDASTDGTQDALKEKVSAVPAKIIYHPSNREKGAAWRAGSAAPTGDIILIQAADLEYNPTDYPPLLEPILTGKADAVF